MGQSPAMSAAAATAATADDLAAEPRLVRGYIGPQILADLGVRYLVDPLVVEGSSWITGANQTGYHATDVVRGRDSWLTRRSAQ